MTQFKFPGNWGHWLLLLIFGISFQPYAIELSATADENGLSVSLSEIRYPKSLLDKTLKSGLANDISLILTVKKQDQVILATQHNYQITYDLWDEVYLVNITKEGVLVDMLMIDSQQALKAQLQGITIVEKQILEPGENYQISGRILANPVETERIDKIKHWIANNRGHKANGDKTGDIGLSANATPVAGPLVSQGSNTASIINQGTRTESLGSARPRFQKLFDKILEQYITRDEIPALWSSETVTIDFQMGAIQKGDKTP